MTVNYSNVLITYLRNPSSEQEEGLGSPYGCLIAQPTDSTPNSPVSIGWAFCNPKDTFAKASARMIATNRANLASSDPDRFANAGRRLMHRMERHPRRMNEYSNFVNRCRTYYKGRKLNLPLDV